MPEIVELPALAPVLCEGLRHQAVGRLREAVECYRRAYDADPGDADALLLLGIAARQSGQFPAAIELISLAVKRRPGASHIHLNLALAYLSTGDILLAAASCQRGLEIDPANGQAWCCLGEIEGRRGRGADAVAAYARALKLPSGAAKAALALGSQLCREQRYEEALSIFGRGIRCAPSNADLHFSAGAAAAMAGKVHDAKASYTKALRCRLSFPEAHLNLGNLLYNEGDFAAAAAAYARAVALRPEYGNAHCNLGNALSSLGRYAEAVRCYERALALDPEAVAARHNLGNALLHRRDYLRAEECFRRVLGREPASAEHHNSLGNALLLQSRGAEAEACYAQALAIKPEYAAAHINLANTLLQLGRAEEMKRHYLRGVELDPQSAGGQYNLALSHLREGNYREGWRGHEWRWDFRELNLPRRSFPQPQWRGEPLHGATILLHAEQGLGDTLQFVRYVPLVAARGGRVVLEVQPRLQPLLEKMDGAAAVLTRGDPLPEFAWHCPLMSLPLAFDTTLESVPSDVPYIRADAAAIKAAWERYPTNGERLRVGLAWAGNPRYKGDRQRSTTLDVLAPLAEVREAVFFSLQFGPAATQIAETHSGFPLIDACSCDRDFSQTAAIAATLDLVISVDTSIAHLAGAMGLPLWVMLSHLADWRWLERRDDSPWYRTARLFRQPVAGDWTSLIETVRDALRGLACATPRITQHVR
ncbi:MAG TPA: tetratricopeptide repeat protein [Acidobacteriaceae bacterium]|nr:tetratricopeptide repeat protein [Acidobacteriaceae bacterium]